MIAHVYYIFNLSCFFTMKFYSKLHHKYQGCQCIPIESTYRLSIAVFLYRLDYRLDCPKFSSIGFLSIIDFFSIFKSKGE